MTNKDDVPHQFTVSVGTDILEKLSVEVQQDLITLLTKEIGPIVDKTVKELLGRVGSRSDKTFECGEPVRHVGISFPKETVEDVMQTDRDIASGNPETPVTHGYLKDCRNPDDIAVEKGINTDLKEERTEVQNLCGNTKADLSSISEHNPTLTSLLKEAVVHLTEENPFPDEKYQDVSLVVITDLETIEHAAWVGGSWWKDLGDITQDPDGWPVYEDLWGKPVAFIKPEFLENFLKLAIAKK